MKGIKITIQHAELASFPYQWYVLTGNIGLDMDNEYKNSLLSLLECLTNLKV
jgi:hypothetical protein